jgi:acetyl-CoA carboxylase biotin carboxyl carrier protein
MNFEIKSELPGIFYRRPSPGEAVCVNEGDTIVEGTVIGMVELMKQFNEVRSGVAGVLERFTVADGEDIDADTLLAVVKTTS